MMIESKKEEYEDVKETVEEVLRNYVKARSDDHFLIFKTLQKLGLLNFDLSKDKLEIERGDISDLPSFETITRVRRKLQSKGLYQAPEEVEEVREIYRVDMRDILTEDR